MNHPVDVHPEELLDREQMGIISTDDRTRLDAHTARCAACALVRSATIEFAFERTPAAEDDALTERIVAAALGRPLASSPPASGYVSSHPRSKRRAWAVAAVVMFAATGATASLWSVRHAVLQRLVGSVPPAIPTAEEGRAAAPKLPASKPLAAPIEPPVAVAAVAVAAAAAAPSEPIPAVVVRPKAADEAPALSPDDIFAAANEARRRGDSTQAIKFYRQLQQQFAGSRPETTSRVLLGRLLLDRGEDPGQALVLFTRYLEASPSGTLAEEARLGRALSLQRLGRTAEERRAWQQLLSAHPNSIHAERAQKRLDELR